MERLGYVRKQRYERVVKESDDLRRTIAELEARIRALEEDRKRTEDRTSRMKGRVEQMRKAVELLEVADMPKETAVGMIKKGLDYLLDILRETGD